MSKGREGVQKKTRLFYRIVYLGNFPQNFRVCRLRSVDIFIIVCPSWSVVIYSIGISKCSPDNNCGNSH